ncbi:hypothetical protein HDU98_011588 [Podochytrium sp. JEL0797]|nr:hypothetical protein HDU98_011588 [Podochytrium sp. JEL0797]
MDLATTEKEHSSRPDKHKKKRRRDASPSSSSSSSSESSDSEEERKRRKRKEKKAKKDKKDKKEKKARKKDKKKKKDKKPAWGSHGIISNTDMWTKEAEFRAWLVDIKNVSPEDRDSKKYFDDFVEDFNMGILPHEKYYNMDAWDKKQIMAQYMAGGDEPQLEFDFARDEQMQKQQLKASKAVTPVMTMSTDELRELKKVQEERLQVERMKKLGYEPSKSMGIRYDKKMLD